MNLSRSLSAALLGALLSSSALAADTYSVDASHSSALFRIQHFGAAWFYGRFNDISGTVVIDEADLTKSTIDLTIKVDSVDTNVQKRDDHLKSPDFFNAAQYPTMTFKSKKVAAKDAKTLTVTGDLTIHGVTKEVTLDVDRSGTGKDPWGGTRTGLEATLNIKRSDYGIAFMPDGLSNDVRLIISLEGVKK